MKTQPRRKRIRAVSPNQRRKLAHYAQVKTAFLAAAKRCDCCLRDVDKCGPVHVHHRRGRIGRLLCATEYWAAVCQHCHEWIHANPKGAQARGLLAGPGEWGKQ